MSLFIHTKKSHNIRSDKLFKVREPISKPVPYMLKNIRIKKSHNVRSDKFLKDKEPSSVCIHVRKPDSDKVHNIELNILTPVDKIKYQIVRLFMLDFTRGKKFDILYSIVLDRNVRLINQEDYESLEKIIRYAIDNYSYVAKSDSEVKTIMSSICSKLIFTHYPCHKYEVSYKRQMIAELLNNKIFDGTSLAIYKTDFVKNNHNRFPDLPEEFIDVIYTRIYDIVYNNKKDNIKITNDTIFYTIVLMPFVYDSIKICPELKGISQVIKELFAYDLYLNHHYLYIEFMDLNCQFQIRYSNNPSSLISCKERKRILKELSDTLYFWYRNGQPKQEISKIELWYQKMFDSSTNFY